MLRGAETARSGDEKRASALSENKSLCDRIAAALIDHWPDKWQGTGAKGTGAPRVQLPNLLVESF